MDFCGFSDEVPPYVLLDVEVRRQLVSDFAEKKTANYRKLSEQLNANWFSKFCNCPPKTLAQRGNLQDKSANLRDIFES